MKKRGILILIITAITFSLTSCGSNKYKNIESYKKALIEYKTEVSYETFEQINIALKQNKDKNEYMDLILETYMFDKVISKSQLEDENKSNSESIESSFYIKKIDYSNRIIQEKRTTDEIVNGTSLGIKNESKSHEIEDFGFQEDDGDLVFVDNVEQTIMNGRDWDSVMSSSYFQDELIFHYWNKNEIYYIDDDVYTVYESNSNNGLETITQITIKDDKITYLEITHHKYDSGLIIKNDVEEINAIYKVATYKNITLEPFDLDGYVNVKVGEL